MANKKYKSKDGLIQVNVINDYKRSDVNQGNNMIVEITEDNHPSSISQQNTINTYTFNPFKTKRQIINSQYGKIIIEKEEA